jgi:glycosyltransferase involved in cell wall biosynthesis
VEAGRVRDVQAGEGLRVNPAVSVIIPVYNTDRFVAQTIESVLTQTFGDFELIAIDDGSTDRSREILDEFAKRDPRVRVVSRANKGLVETLNEGLSLARGPLVARMDADDLCDPRRIELQVRSLTDDPRLVAVGCSAAAIDEEGNVLGDYSTPATHEEIEVSHLKGHSAIHHPSVMFRTDVVRRLGGYRDLVPCEDFDLWLRLGEVGRLANLPEKLITKRLFPGSIVARTLDKRQRVLTQILREAWDRRKLPGDPPPAPQPIADRAALFRQWGWMALKGGHVRTSRRYAFKALATQPFRTESWRLVACSLRGR